MRSTLATHARWILALFIFSLAARSTPADEAHPVSNFQPKQQANIVPAEAKLEHVWSGGAFTEGPAPLADGTLLFSDIGDRILRYDPREGKVSEYRNPSGKANGLMFDAHGRLVACEGAGPGGKRRISITDQQGNVARWPTLSRANGSTAPTTWRSRQTVTCTSAILATSATSRASWTSRPCFWSARRQSERRHAERGKAKRHPGRAQQQAGLRGRQQQRSRMGPTSSWRSTCCRRASL